MRESDETLKDKRGVLFVDGHAAHEELSSLQALQKCCVDVVELHPHSSHLTQPLDVAVFKPWRDSLRKVCYSVVFPPLLCLIFLTFYSFLLEIQVFV